jgi:uncharacterized protein (TIRG00374 family)
MSQKPVDFNNILKTFSPKKIIIPIVIGLLAIVLAFFFQQDFDLDKVVQNIGRASMAWIVMAFVVLLIRDGGYMYRIKNLTNNQITWKSSFYIILLWEFSSAVTPSVVGGTAIAVFIMNREGLSFGKSLSFVMLTAVLDNSFFMIASVLVLILVPNMFEGLSGIFQSGGAQGFFYTSLFLIFAYTILMVYGLFVSPNRFKLFLVSLTANRLLKRFRRWAVQTGNETITASEFLKGMTYDFWLKAILSTLVIWLSRYFMLNCLIAAFAYSFNPLSVLDHLTILSRQIIMWIIMLVSPTPGSAGSAELAFTSFFDSYLQVSGLTLVVAAFWRLITYYAYLLIGILLIPQWLRRILATKANQTN